MLSIYAALPLSLFLWLCCIIILAIGLATVAAALLRLGVCFTSRCWRTVLGSLIAAFIWGFFGCIVSLGAIDLGGSVVDGMIARWL